MTIPQTPEHWRSAQLRHFTSFTTGWTPPTGDDSAYYGDHAWANISDLREAWIDSTAKSLSSDAVAGQTRAETGDLLFSFKLSVGAVSRAAQPMYTNEAIATFKPSSDLDLGYAFYALPVWVPLNASTNIYGAALLNSTLIRSAPFAAPPIYEQRAIADYLDRETARIDALVAQQGALIAHLGERKRSLIAQEFARLGAPATQLAALSRPGEYFDGDWVESKDQDPEGNIRLLQLADVGDGVFKNRSDRRINIATFDRLRCSRVKAGDILIARMPDPIGRACVVPSDLGQAITVVDVAVLRPDKTRVVKEFAVYAINEDRFRSQIESMQDGATRQRIPRKRLGRQLICLPSLAVQTDVVSRLDGQTAKIDGLIAKADQFIALAKERRAALITAAVTGQIDVGAA